MFRRRRSEEDFAEEIRSHLALPADELEREGFSAEPAHRKARIEFGGVRAAQERFHLKDRVEWLDSTLRDLNFAVRRWRSCTGLPRGW
jgi:hypothetical protein